MEQWQAVVGMALTWVTGAVGSVIITWIIRQGVNLVGLQAKTLAAVIATVVGIAVGLSYFGVPHTASAVLTVAIGSAIAAEAVYRYLNMNALLVRGEPAKK